MLDNESIITLSQPIPEVDIKQFISPNLFPKASTETPMYLNIFDNYEYVKSLRCDKKNRSYGIIGIQPQSYKMMEILDAFFSSIKKSLYIHNEKICKKIIHLACYNFCIEQLKFLMVTKKYTYGFYDFINNKYNIENNIQIGNLINEMTEDELKLILTQSFNTLWNMTHVRQKYPLRYEKNFNKVKQKIKSNVYNIKKSSFLTPDWEFPKGKKEKTDNNDLETAIREFKEETGLKDEDFKVYDNIKPLVENYKGTDGLNYAYFYYIAIIKPDIILNVERTGETSNIGLYSYFSSLNNIRNYQKERKIILENIFNDIVQWINKKYQITITKNYINIKLLSEIKIDDIENN